MADVTLKFYGIIILLFTKGIWTNVNKLYNNIQLGCCD